VQAVWSLRSLATLEQTPCSQWVPLQHSASEEHANVVAVQQRRIAEAELTATHRCAPKVGAQQSSFDSHGEQCGTQHASPPPKTSEQMALASDAEQRQAAVLSSGVHPAPRGIGLLQTPQVHAVPTAHSVLFTQAPPCGCVHAPSRHCPSQQSESALQKWLGSKHSWHVLGAPEDLGAQITAFDPLKPQHSPAPEHVCPLAKQHRLGSSVEVARQTEPSSQHGSWSLHPVSPTFSTQT
jgi:hypothetical protein